ncbi:MAG: Hint domain-containing protein [Acetobacter okinawensis]|uniref:Hint domain-containing protein n=2 Tax=Acetobacter okinawensis TaxID=1076594 RepID=UPI0039EC9B96
MANYVNTHGVTCAITDHQGFYGVRDGYSVTMTGPDGVPLYTGVIHPAIFGGPTNGNVLLGPQAVTCAAPAGGTYIVPPGIYATFDIGPATGHAPLGGAFYIGGNALLRVALGAPAGLLVQVVGGCAMFAPMEPGATLDGMELGLAYGGLFTCGTAKPDVLCGATVRFGQGGGTLVLNAGHAPFDLSGTRLVDYNPAHAMIEVYQSSQPIVAYHVSADRQSRSIVLYGHNQQEVGRFTVELARGAVLEEGDYHVADAANPLRIATDPAQTRTMACVIEGTHIHTASAITAQDTLHTGSLVDVWGRDGTATQRLMWVGRGHVQVRPDLEEEEAGYPIRILKHALGPNTPERDLLLTPHHSVQYNGQFIAVRMLVNGCSIFYDHSITSYHYTLMQTQTHAVLVADGVPTEFYLARGAGHGHMREGAAVRLGQTCSYAREKEVLPQPLRDRAQLATIFDQLRLRGASIPGSRPVACAPELVMDPNLLLITDKGQRIRLLRRDGDRCIYMLPVGVEKVFLASRTSQPSAVLGPYMDDRRTLGVAVGGIILFSGGRHVAQTRHLRPEGAGWSGWHAVEADGLSRWTSGHAELPLCGMREGQMGLLTIQVRAAGPFAVAPTVEAVAQRLHA